MPITGRLWPAVFKQRLRQTDLDGKNTGSVWQTGNYKTAEGMRTTREMENRAGVQRAEQANECVRRFVPATFEHLGSLFRRPRSGGRVDNVDEYRLLLRIAPGFRAPQ